jgi:type II secretory pathway pseudopilin PulG
MYLQPDKLKNNFKRAFTLVEALVALSILIVGIISGFILVTKALYDVTIIQDRLTASFLAQEGLELVRQIRDTNYLKKLNEGTGNWDDGLNNGDNIVIVNTNTGSVTLLSSSNPSYDPYLYYHPLTGLYDHDSSGSKTSFQRVINIYHIPPNDPNANEIRVQSIMDWKSKNINFEFTAEDHLFNWLSI